jgi:hypothetical protein
MALARRARVEGAIAEVMATSRQVGRRSNRRHDSAPRQHAETKRTTAARTHLLATKSV